MIQCGTNFLVCGSNHVMGDLVLKETLGCVGGKVKH